MSSRRKLYLGCLSILALFVCTIGIVEDARASAFSYAKAETTLNIDILTVGGGIGFYEWQTLFMPGSGESQTGDGTADGNVNSNPLFGDWVTNGSHLTLLAETQANSIVDGSGYSQQELNGMVVLHGGASGTSFKLEWDYEVDSTWSTSNTAGIDNFTNVWAGIAFNLTESDGTIINTMWSIEHEISSLNGIAESISPTASGIGLFTTKFVAAGETAYYTIWNDSDAEASSSLAAPVPEPATVALLGIGLVGMAGAEVRRRRKKKVVDKS